MDTGLLVQYAVIALAVLLSVGYVARRQFPGPVRKLRIACALPLVRGRASWLRRVGLWIAPRASAGDGACGSSGCNGCGPTQPSR